MRSIARYKLATASRLPPNPRICSRAKSIRIANVGITAPFIDTVGQSADLRFPLNNTYGIDIFHPVTVEDLAEQAEAPGGCFDMIDDCRNITNGFDPEGWGNAPEVYTVCNNAYFTFYQLMESRYEATGHENWIVGEAIALALARHNRARFAAAGYAPLSVPGVSTSKAGYVRQAGCFSFSVVTNAGHEISYYQPATAYAIYQRAIEGRDVVTGKKAIGNGDKYATGGPKDMWGVRTSLPPEAPMFCYTASTSIVRGQCTDAPLTALVDGMAIIKDFVVMQPAWSG
ncbi:hypothetical protein VDGE_30440 [Verticillium dahliae]|uniref:Uncharacterized protein n=1 Tax=Verticillium dahliae TaxID=27337 RepID=A0A444S4L7_VERDA|nr:hypothetical protein VDGE_30440 [Verticillium dahliae]